MRVEEAKETLEEYRRKGLGARIGFGKSPAVLVVDFIIGFTDLESPLAAPLDKELSATLELLAAARHQDLPVVFSTVAYDPGCRESGYFVKKIPSLECLQKGSRWVEVDPRLKRRKEEILIEKKFASCFFGTSLAAYLTSLAVDTVLVAGCTTSGCVRASVVDGLQSGFRPIVPVECVGDRAEGPHVANLLDMDAKYADVVSLDETISYLKKLPGRSPGHHATGGR